jgi:hypothetical protein
MKKLASIKNRIIGFLSLLFISIVSFSQQEGGGGTDIDVNIQKEGEWYTQPWVWIVGGAVFILLLVALLRGGRRAE